VQFTPVEIEFLLQPHRTETADRRRSELKPMLDIRALGCPDAIFNRILESRARQLGPRFAEFRDSQNRARAAHASQIAADAGLDERIASAKPF
jgi:hypothetical protein